jgi:hypothetical protein
MKTIRVSTENQAKFFAFRFQAASGYSFPHEMFLENPTLAVQGAGLMAGICFIEDKKNFRVSRQVPAEAKAANEWRWPHEKDTCELTAFWTNGSKHPWFLASVALYVVLSKKKYFIYSYPSDCLKLSQYYSKGKPTRLYSGPMSTGDNETVEYLTKTGIVRVFVSRIWTQAKRTARGS